MRHGSGAVAPRGDEQARSAPNTIRKHELFAFNVSERWRLVAFSEGRRGFATYGQISLRRMHTLDTRRRSICARAPPPRKPSAIKSRIFSLRRSTAWRSRKLQTVRSLTRSRGQRRSLPLQMSDE